MTFAEWITQVLAIARQRGLTASVSYPGPGLATFTWNGSYRQGVAGAGVSMFELTPPEVFTRLWYDGAPRVGGPELAVDEWTAREFYRVARYVPKIPARGVSWALAKIFP